jgi:arabinofuranosyltransferase
MPNTTINISKRAFLVLVLLAATAMLLCTAWMGDDAFITLRVIDNFVNGYGLRFNVLERVQAFTHPLWMICLTPFYAATHEPLMTVMLVSIATTLAALWVLAAKLAKQIEFGTLLILVFVASASLNTFATSGLETPLTFLLIAIFVFQCRDNKIIGAPIIAGLMLFNRLDLIVLIAPALIYLFALAKGKRRLHIMGAPLFPAMLWMIFSLVYYGAPFPNTALAKLGTGLTTSALISRGLTYMQDFISFDPLLATLIAAVLVYAIRAHDWLARSLGAGILSYLAYIVFIGGDFMSGRYYAPPGFVALCILAQSSVPYKILKWHKEISAAGIVALSLLTYARATAPMIDMQPLPPSGIIDERLYYYEGTGLLNVLKGYIATGVEPIPPDGLTGLEMKKIYESRASQGNLTPIAVSGDYIGMRGYYSGPNIHLVDHYALADAFLARLPALPDSRVGHYERILPPGYPESSANPFPTTSDAALRPLLYDVILTTRAPLFAEGRWAAIWRLLTGQYDWVYDHAKVK